MNEDDPPEDDSLEDDSLEDDSHEDDYHPDEDDLDDNYYLGDEDDEDEEEESDGNEMSFLEHLEEARHTLLICGASVFIGITLVFVFLGKVSQWLIFPLDLALGDNSPGLEGLITTGPMDVFIVMIQIGFIGGLVMALPVILYSIGKFVAPGLKENEIRLLRPVLIAAFFLFLLGCAFSFFLMLPLSLRASMYFNEMMGFQNYWKAQDYFGLVVWMVLAIGLSFESPLILVALIKTGLVTTAQLIKYRSYSFVIVLVLSAMITPTADLTFLLLAGPMYIMYEGGIFVGKRIERKREQKDN